MTNSEAPLPPPSVNNVPRWLPWAYLSLGFLGFLDAGYLTAHHYLGTPLLCSIVQGCETVTSSVYSQVFGIPVALLGWLYYVSVVLLTVWYFDCKRAGALRFIERLTVLGFLASLWFVFAQLVLLKAICLYCLFSAFISTSLFVVALMARRLRS